MNIRIKRYLTFLLPYDNKQLYVRNLLVKGQKRYKKELCNKEAGFQNIDCRQQELLNIPTTREMSFVI